MPSLTSRPKIIDRWIKLKSLQSEISARLAKIKEPVEEILASTDIEGITLVRTNRREIDAEKAVKWLKQQLRSGEMSKETFNSLFVRVFDQNRFVDLLKKNAVCRASLPKGIIKVKKGRYAKVVKLKA